tara:strand:- start:128 stop:433 length:306 start_codon:yes stop_codon:yes gene_type:complete
MKDKININNVTVLDSNKYSFYNTRTGKTIEVHRYLISYVDRNWKFVLGVGWTDSRRYATALSNELHPEVLSIINNSKHRAYATKMWNKDFTDYKAGCTQVS